jgi:IS5 family transposase
MEANRHVAMRPGKCRALDAHGSHPGQAGVGQGTLPSQSGTPSVNKRQFTSTKVKYRELAKNTANLMTLVALSNLWMARRSLLQELQG